MNHRALTIAAICLLAGCSLAHKTPGEEVGQRIAQMRAANRTSLDLSNLVVGARELAEIAKADEITELRLDRTQLNDDNLPALLPLQRLELLHLGDASITDVGFVTLKQFPALRVLSLGPPLVRPLASTRITAEGVADLKLLSKLEHLRISSDRVDDDIIRVLESFPSLQSVHLINAPVTDATLDALAAGALPNLQSFYADEVSFSDSAIERLQAARPRLHVHIGDAP